MTQIQAEALAAYEAELERREAAATAAMAEAKAAAEAAREEMARAHAAVLGGVEKESAKRKEQLEAAGITAISATMRRMVNLKIALSNHVSIALVHSRPDYNEVTLFRSVCSPFLVLVYVYLLSPTVIHNSSLLYLLADYMNPIRIIYHPTLGASAAIAAGVAQMDQTSSGISRACGRDSEGKRAGAPVARTKHGRPCEHGTVMLHGSCL